MNPDLMEKCTNCGAALSADAPQGLCPLCLLRGGLRSGPFHNFTPPPPEELARHFPQMEILGLLGRGGMGVVYKARQRHLDRVVALKILPADTQGDPAFAERFSREARALAKLSHPNIVAVHDFGESNGLFYFVMEYVDGVNLRQAMNAQPISPAQALAIVPQICDALQYAHDKGIVHRDIKPENILLDQEGRAKIADFGLAKLLTAESIDLTLTQVGQAMGTTHYMAPEQLEHPEDVDHRADIYSLGVVFYQMLTRELPIGRFAAPSRKVQIDVRLDEIVLRTLEKEPELRYPQAGELKTDISRVVSTPASPSPPPPPNPPSVGRTPRTPKPRWRWVALVLAPVLGFMLGEVMGPPRQYKSTVTLELKPDALGLGQRDPRILNAAMRPEILGPVIESLQLRQRWTSKTEAETLLKLRGELSFTELRDSNLVQIDATDSDPRLAAAIANAVAEEWKKQKIESRKQSSERDLWALQEEVAKQLQDTEIWRKRLTRLREAGVPDSDPDKNGGGETAQFAEAYRKAIGDYQRALAEESSAPGEPPGKALQIKTLIEAFGSYQQTKADYLQAKRLSEAVEKKLAEEKAKAAAVEPPLVIWEKAEVPGKAMGFPTWPAFGTMIGLFLGILLFFVGGHYPRQDRGAMDQRA